MGSCFSSPGKDFRGAKDFRREPQYYPKRNPPGMQYRVSQGSVGSLAQERIPSVVRVLMDYYSLIYGTDGWGKGCPLPSISDTSIAARGEDFSFNL